jgi:hypothetical protein
LWTEWQQLASAYGIQSETRPSDHYLKLNVTKNSGVGGLCMGDNLGEGMKNETAESQLGTPRSRQRHQVRKINKTEYGNSDTDKSF